MIKLNQTSVAIGEIKQILHTFNLPRCAVLNQEADDAAFTAYNDFQVSGYNHFILSHSIFKVSQSSDTTSLEKVFIEPYIYGKKYLNLTTTLPISNQLYDRSTHRYLGKYLRFIRNYHNINLLSMYNCFDGEMNYIDFSFESNESDMQQDSSESNTAPEINFKTTDEQLVYKVPIALADHSFTIKVFDSSPVELCLLVDTQHSSTKITNEDSKRVAQLTFYTNRNSKAFKYNPFLQFINPIDEDHKRLSSFISKNAEHLFILIKTPFKTKVGITVLDGDYLEPTIKPHYIEPGSGSTEFNFNVYPQLLSYEAAADQYLLADNLLQYLTKNTITAMSYDYDVGKMQKAYKKFSLLTKSSEENKLNMLKDTFDWDYNPQHYSVWQPEDLKFGQQILQYLLDKNVDMQTFKYHNFDKLGYLDKDLENYLASKEDGFDALV